MGPSLADYAHQIQIELARLGAVEDDTLDAPIPHIEGWTVHAVVGHTGWICRWVDQCLQTTAEEPPSRSEIPEPPPGADVIAWFHEGVGMVLDTIQQADLEDQARFTWIGPQPGSWWLRRLAHESAMHRWDVSAAIGSPEAIDAALARDGIDEVFEVFAPARLQFDALAAAGESMHLHATDIDDGEWMVQLGADSLDWSRAHEKGDVAARGPVSDLLLLLWSRIPPSRLELHGNAELLDRWQAAAVF